MHQSQDLGLTVYEHFIIEFSVSALSSAYPFTPFTYSLTLLPSRLVPAPAFPPHFLLHPIVVFHIGN